ncbi:TIGR02300 family protein [Brevundimonas sp. UBA2416]|uniref:TIGR02300 family protein n=1 Tax=Brevundimonas sp. UBA2416 TaxID=1946124 RepID=UPI0025BBD09E|nr:TIGR02300 family protein [Brevundimonas sp. UBA2416]HRJ64077.1 TIGR02300 family protein [Brevundimonas sp.]
MAKPELGQKQVCPNCQAKFYDLGRRPAHCPKCSTDFDPEEALKLRNRRGRPAGYPADDADEDQVKDKKVDGDEDEEEEAVATPEIDQEGHEPILTPDDDDDAPVDPTEEPGMGEAVEDDDVLADDDDDSVPFIEDEDDDGFEDEILTPKEDE